MVKVRYPEPHFRTKEESGGRYIFDEIRKAWLLLTEEEWVRQNFVAYLIAVLAYPKSLIALEKEILLNGLKKRFDILIYGKDHQSWMLVECKAPQVALNEDALQQVLRYNISVPVQYIVITNGAVTIGWQKLDGRLAVLEEMPSFE